MEMNTIKPVDTGIDVSFADLLKVSQSEAFKAIGVPRWMKARRVTWHNSETCTISVACGTLDRLDRTVYIEYGDFVADGYEPTGDFVPLDSKTLEPLLEATSVDQWRPTLSYVYLSGDKAVATDSHRMRVIDYRSEYVGLIHRFAVQAGGFTPCAGNRVRIDVGSLRIYVREPEGNFPNWDRVIPSDAQYPIFEVGCRNLVFALKDAMPLAKQESNRVTIEAGDGRITLSVMHNFGDCKKFDYRPVWSRQISAYQLGRFDKIAFNTKYLLAALKGKNGNVIFKQAEPIRPALIKFTDSSDIEVIMPMNPL